MKRLFRSLISLVNLTVRKKILNVDINNYCYYHSLYLYDLFKTINPSGNYKVNILLSENGEWGHAWLSNDDIIVLKEKREDTFSIEKIGENIIYNYWIVL